jgi:two-component system sensor histidine kinase BaeS
MLDGVYPADEAILKSTLEESQILTRLVDDLRTLALAESGALELKVEPTDLSVLIHETAAAFRPQAEAKGASITIEVPPDAPLIDLDSVRIRQVLVNLMANALRYTPAGGLIQVRFKMVSQGKGTGAEIAIRDTGPGIKPEDLPYMFDRFYKTRDSGGMGLGLAIAKGLVEAHHGTITATSEEDQGTLMIILLPVLS